MNPYMISFSWRHVENGTITYEETSTYARHNNCARFRYLHITKEATTKHAQNLIYFLPISFVLFKHYFSYYKYTMNNYVSFIHVIFFSSSLLINTTTNSPLFPHNNNSQPISLFHSFLVSSITVWEFVHLLNTQWKVETRVGNPRWT